jgi:PHD/YefM family antitoxin component YafN of YafNO toxin-antitoxin module
MSITTFSSREVNQDLGRAKRAAEHGPVVITDRGKPAYVLLRHDAYRKLIGKATTLREALAQPDVEDFEFDPPRLGQELMKVPDLS